MWNTHSILFQMIARNPNSGWNSKKLVTPLISTLVVQFILCFFFISENFNTTRAQVKILPNMVTSYSWLFLPALFVATHTYWPLSPSSLYDISSCRPLPRKRSLPLSCTGVWPLRHSTSGKGVPMAGQLSSTDRPLTTWWWSSILVVSI